MLNPMDLSGKQILIVGAASDIGQAVAKKLYQLNAKIIIVDRDGRKLKVLSTRLGRDVQYYNFDIYKISIIEKKIKQIVNELGKFSGFVYSAGIGVVRPLALTKHQYIISMMNTNFSPFVELSRALLKKNSFKNGGSVVAISSISSIKGLKSKLAYSASKAALDAAVRCLAAELSEREIRVNSILKGSLTTDSQIGYIKNIIDLNDNEILKKQVLGLIQPEEIANLVAFLLSDAVKTLTGTSIILDGGFTL